MIQERGEIELQNEFRGERKSDNGKGYKVGGMGGFEVDRVNKEYRCGNLGEQGRCVNIYRRIH